MKFKASKVFVFLLSLLTVISSLFFILYASFVLQSLLSGVSFLDSLFAQPLHYVESVSQNIGRVTETFSENAKLKAQLYQNSIDINELDSLKKENGELRSLLDISTSFDDYEKIGAEVFQRNTVAWLDSLEVDAGKEKGVSDKFVVVANGGLVGIVTNVRQSTSRVTLLTTSVPQENLTVKIQAKSGPIYGVLSGFNREKSAFIVKQLNDSSAVIDENSQVMTSGLGDYPVANVPIGEVLSVVDGVGGNLDREVLVKPAANFEDISVVMLVGQ